MPGTTPARWSLDQLVVPGLIVALIGALSLLVLTQPHSVLVILMAGTVGLAASLRWPAELITVAVLSRLIVDLLWWVEWSMAGVNFMEVYTGAVAVLVFFLVLTHLEQLQSHPLFTPIMLFMAVLALGAIQSTDLRNGLEYALRYGLPFLLLLLVWGLFDESQVWRLLKLLVIIGSVPLLFSFYNLLGGRIVSEANLDYDRFLGAYGALHNHGHMMLAMSVMSLVAAEIVKNRTIQTALRVYTAIALINLYFSHVRTAQLALVVFCVVFFAIGRNKGALLILGVGAVALLVTSDTAQRSLADIPSLIFYDPVETDLNALGSGRVAIWTTTTKNFLAKPAYTWLLGLGLGQHVFLSPSGYHDTHNDFLGLVLQTGVIGLVLYVFIFVKSITRALEVLRAVQDERTAILTRAALAFLSAAVFANLLSNAFLPRVTPGWLLWILVGSIYVLGRGLQSRSSEAVTEKALLVAPRGI